MLPLFLFDAADDDDYHDCNDDDEDRDNPPEPNQVCRVRTVRAPTIVAIVIPALIVHIAELTAT